jgi:hypothetical protein
MEIGALVTNNLLIPLPETVIQPGTQGKVIGHASNYQALLVVDFGAETATVATENLTLASNP